MVYNRRNPLKEIKMDTFFVLLIKIKLTGKVKAIIVGAILLDIVIVAAVTFFALLFLSPAFTFLIVAAVVYGSYKIISSLSVEFEYIFTNGDLDIDKITAKSSRKRMVSIKCSEIEKYGEYKGQIAPGSVKNTFFFCNPDSEGQVYIIAKDRNLGMVMMVLAPEERVKTEIEKAVPRLAK